MADLLCPQYGDPHSFKLYKLLQVSVQVSNNTSCSICVYLPGLSSADGEGTTRWVVLGLSLHTAGITAMIWFCQTKATYDFSPSCRTNEHTPEIRWISALCKFEMSSTRWENVALTKPGQVLLLLGCCAVRINRVHDQWRLNAHYRPISTVHPLNLSGNQTICHITRTCTTVPCSVKGKNNLKKPTKCNQWNITKSRKKGGRGSIRFFVCFTFNSRA